MSEIKLDPRNYRKHGDKNKQLINESLKNLGAGRSIVVDKDDVIIAGNGVFEQAKEIGLKVRVIETNGTELIAIKRTDLSTEDEKRKLLAIADNKTSDTSEFDFELLSNDFEFDFLNELGFEIEDFTISGFDEEDEKEKTTNTLTERFLIPPFSVLDTKQAYWMDRRKQWESLGFDSQKSREEVYLMADSAQSPEIYELKNELRKTLKREPSWEEVIRVAEKRGMNTYSGASIFDPVLAEISYLWFCPTNGKILDPFAGGSVRGIVANYLGFNYTGIDLRKEQVEENINQADLIFKDVHPLWLVGDSNKVLDDLNEKFDFIFSCPPYHDLEVYSEDEADLSNMSYDDFITIYKEIIQKSISKLKDDRFACFVVSEIRDKEGFYKNFVKDTINAFEESGARFYNEIILLNQLGSLPIRVSRQFNAGRKVGRTHQNVLVFYKGNPKEIKNNFNEINIKETFS